MREIEVKAKLRDKNAVMENLRSLGCAFDQPIKQFDRIFTEDEYVNRLSHAGNVLRIRKQNEKILLTLKRNVTNELDCIEKEISIDNVDEAEGMLKLMGYREAVQVRKIRQKCKYKEYEICLDEVEELGDFIEIETLVSENARVNVQDHLFGFLKSLGILENDRITEGYDTLMDKFKNAKK